MSIGYFWDEHWVDEDAFMKEVAKLQPWELAEATGESVAYTKQMLENAKTPQDIAEVLGITVQELSIRAPWDEVVYILACAGAPCSNKGCPDCRPLVDAIALIESLVRELMGEEK